MTTRTDIDTLARLLDDGAAPDVAASAEDQQLAGLAALLSAAGPEVPPMREEFRMELRAQLVEAARERNAEPALLTRLRDGVQRFRYSTGLAGATGLASVALAGGGVAGAAEHAQPGELLYPTRIALEDVRLAVSGDEVSRGRRAIAYALDRLDEARLAVAEDDHDRAAIALAGAAERTREGHEAIVRSGDDPRMLDVVDALGEARGEVVALLEVLDGPAAVEAAALLIDLDAALGTVGARFTAPPAPVGPAIITVPAPDPEGLLPPAVAPPAQAPLAPSTPPAATAPVAPAVPDATPSAAPADDPVGSDPEVPLPQAPSPPPAGAPDLGLPTAPGSAGAVEEVLDGVIGGASAASADSLLATAVEDLQDAVDGLVPGQ